MKVKKILITGDDGYQALGLRIVVAALKHDYELKIAATKEQRSATGGSLARKGIWGMDEIDGIEALWVDGTPGNAVECANVVFGNDFDLIISGMNQGPNVGSCNVSGTVGAALQGLSCNLVDKAIALSWNLPASAYFEHDGLKSVEEYFNYPGKAIQKIIETTIIKDFWQAEFLNINLPFEFSDKAKFCRPIYRENIDFFDVELLLDKQNMTFKREVYGVKTTELDFETEATAIHSGFISITPWLANLYLNSELLGLIGKEISLT